MIDPSIWDDEELAQLTRDERLLFIGLVSTADDYGHNTGNPATLRKRIFGFDEDLTMEDVRIMRDRIIQECRNVKLYQLDGREYIWLEKWERHQDLRFRGKAQYPCHKCGQYHTEVACPGERTTPEPPPQLSQGAVDTTQGLAQEYANTTQGECKNNAPREEKRREEVLNQEKSNQEGKIGAAQTPPPQLQPASKVKRKLKEHHALADLWKSHMGQYPNAQQEAEIVATITDSVLFARCLKEWRLRGFSPVNAVGVLDWYRQGGPPKSGPSQKSREPPAKREMDYTVGWDGKKLKPAEEQADV